MSRVCSIVKEFLQLFAACAVIYETLLYCAECSSRNVCRNFEGLYYCERTIAVMSRMCSNLDVILQLFFGMYQNVGVLLL